jgi:DNA invertase Pin-like site-specific DNA recombinase
MRNFANLKSLKDTWLDLSENNPYSQFLMTVMGGVNQLERDLIRMGQSEEIEIEKKENIKAGKKIPQKSCRDETRNRPL